MAPSEYVLDDIITELNGDQLKLLAEFWAKLDVLTDGRITDYTPLSLDKLGRQSVSLPNGESMEVDMAVVRKKPAQKALSETSPGALRAALLRNVKHEDPDALLVRFLRARSFNIDDALIMLLKSLAWRIDTKLEEGLLAGGDVQYARMAESGTPEEQKIAKEVLALGQSGVSSIHGSDKAGRLVKYLRIKLHSPSAQSKEAFEKAIVLDAESARMLLRSPITTVSVVFDMTGFGMRNMDMNALKIMAGGLQDNYPESLGMVYVYNAPWIVNGIWAAVRGWLDPVVASKVQFLNSVEQLAEFIPIENIPTYMGGKSDWEYKWIDPQISEPHTEDEAKLGQLRSERDDLLLKHTEATRVWGAQILKDGSPHPDTDSERKRLAYELRENYWKLDPFVRGRVLLDRAGVLLPGGEVDLKAGSKVAS